VTTESRNETAVVQIRKGMRDGAEVVFEGVGNVGQDQLQGDVIFILKEQPHERCLLCFIGVYL
jgi:DnaJ-class molecular chaperone